jgi:thymidylate synthase
MTQADKTYLYLLRDIMENGVEKDTRAGRVKSVFGRQLRFNLKEGLPLLTTKKVFIKGVIHELLWFLQRPYNSHGSMNIEYLIRNGVHIWDDDAYRWFKNEIVNEYKGKIKKILVCTNDDNFGKKPVYEYWINGETVKNDDAWLENITKEEFLDLTLQRVEIRGSFELTYRFGDLGQIYGKQWRAFGYSMVDQINEIISTLKNNPNDRRMLCVAFNPDVLALGNAALPPCHTMFQFYTRELTKYERWGCYKERTNDIDTYEIITNPFTHTNTKLELEAKLEENKIPLYGLSCMYVCRSQDCFLGSPFNIASYSILTHVIAKLVNMVPDKVIASLGDCHIYEAHFDAVKEQLTRKGSDALPKLVIHGKQKTIEDFNYEDFEIIGYNPDPPIKAPLLVGI